MFIMCPKLIVAAVNGDAFGFGAALISLCDVVYSTNKVCAKELIIIATQKLDKYMYLFLPHRNHVVSLPSTNNECDAWITNPA